MNINDLNFSTTYEDTSQFPTGPRPWRTFLQQLHNETKTHINGEIKSAILNLGSRVLLPVPSYGAGTAVDTIGYMGFGSNVANFISSTNSNTYYAVANGGGTYLSKACQFTKKTTALYISQVSLYLGNANASVYYQLGVRNGVNYADPVVSGATSYGTVQTVTTANFSWLSYLTFGLFTFDPGTYSFWGEAKADNNGCSLKAADGVMLIIPFGVTGT